ncbi:MAG: hypothetical protein AAF153_02640, partial [Pseudomonadota bacterium]
ILLNSLIISFSLLTCKYMWYFDDFINMYKIKDITKNLAYSTYISNSLISNIAKCQLTNIIF